MNGNKGNVLIVDDEPDAIRVLSATLLEDGYRVLESYDVKMRNSFPDFLVCLPPEDTFTKFLRDRIDVSKAKAPRLAALIDFRWGNQYSQDISVSIEPGFLLTPIRAVEYKIATNLWVNATRKRRDLTEITCYTWITPKMGCYPLGLIP